MKRRVGAQSICMKHRRALLAMVLALFAGGVVAVNVLHNTNTVDLSLSLSGWQERVDDCLVQTPEDFAARCVQDLAELAGKQGRIGSGLAILRYGSEKNQSLTGKCHNETHGLGRRALELGASLDDVYSVSFADCRFGFYHGALEKHTESLELVRLEAELPSLCAPFGDETSAATGECVHVLGHFVFDRTQPDVASGIAVCQVLPQEQLQARCVDGLLMQAIDLVRGAVGDPTNEHRELLVNVWGAESAVQQQRVSDICSSLANGPLVYTCYTNASQALAVLWSFDYVKVQGFCEDLDSSWRQPCFEGIAASGFTGLDWDVEKIAGACHAGTSPDTRHCMRTLAFTFALQGTDAQREIVCSFARDYERDDCAAGLSEGTELRGALGQEVAGSRDDYSLYTQ